MKTLEVKHYKTLSLIALVFEAIPFILNSAIIPDDIYFEFNSVFSFLSFTFPLIGFIIAIYIISKGISKTGKTSRVLAIIAIIIPLLIVGFYVFMIVGISTGLISLF